MMFKCKKQCVFLKVCAISFLLLMVTFSLPALCAGHLSESPSYKYSREANENLDKHENKELHSHIPEWHGSAHTHGEPGIRSTKQIDMAEVWLYSVCSTLFISAVPFLLLFVIPLDNSHDMKSRLKVLLAFASGGLLGDAFLHLIPHATIPHHNHNSHEHSNEHSHHTSVSHDHVHNKDTIISGLWVLGGIIAFLTVEKLVRLIKDENSFHGHSHITIKNKQEAKKDNDESVKKTNKKLKDRKNKKDEFATSGYLNLAADFTHNFTDGLAIGASFLAGNSIGIVTSITILLHEIPHEIGDFAILIKSGCSRRKAMLLQLVTAFGALAGNVLALTGVGTEPGAFPWVLPFTAGGFIYIATVSVLPELLEESTKLGQSIKEICALLTGVILMVFIANFE